jgi:hypothetical protein
VIKNLKILLTLVFFLHHAFLCRAAALASDIIIIKAKQAKLGLSTSPSILKKSFAKKCKPSSINKRNLLGGVSFQEGVSRPDGVFILIALSTHFANFSNSSEVVFIRNNSPPAEI